MSLKKFYQQNLKLPMEVLIIKLQQLHEQKEKDYIQHLKEQGKL